MSFNGHLTDYLSQHAKSSPNKLALVTDGKTLTWRELWERVQAGAAHLDSQLSDEPRQIVAILMPNTWQYVVAYLSIIHAGHTALPVDVIYKPLEIQAVLGQVPPAAVITDATNKPRINSRGLPVLGVEDFPAAVPKTLPDYPRLDPRHQIACLLFTSGTTGKPKVVPCSHASHLWNIKVCSQVWGWTAEDSQLLSLRLSHWYGLVMGLSGTLYHGNTLYLQDGFDPKKTLRTLAAGQISIFTHGPQAYANLLGVADPSKYDLSSVRLFISGSGPLPPSTWQKFKDVFGQEILEVYGSSETGRIASNLLSERIPGSPGRPLPEVRVTLSSDNEVLVKSPGLFGGYFKNSEATAKSLTPDGFWRTGDIGEFENGRLILKGRTQERIRRQGYTISPRDVEWALHQNPHIKEVLVMGLPRPDSPNDKLVYFFVGELSDEALKEFYLANLPSIWRPDAVFRLEQLPRTRSGKPQLAKLKAMVN